MTVSVIMATYNGEKYIKTQLDSIVNQLQAGDELVVTDDGSKDQTIAIVNDYKAKYGKIILTEGPHQGSTMNFASAIPKCSGDIILFSDQDDIWNERKIAEMRAFFADHPKVDLVMHNADYCDGDGAVIEGDIFGKRHSQHGFLANLIYSTYYGCCMGVRKDFLMKCIPLPAADIPFDQYFSLLAEKKHCAAFLKQTLITHRYHGNNQSHKLTIEERLAFRANLLKNVNKCLKRDVWHET